MSLWYTSATHEPLSVTVDIPNRPVFRAQEVCDLAEVQPYVLRTWEAEFPDLGVAKAPNGPRLYRRADVERVLRIKHLLFVDGLTMAGARRRLAEESASAQGEPVASAEADLAEAVDGESRERLREVRRDLQWILGVLSAGRPQAESGEFVLQSEVAGSGSLTLGSTDGNSARSSKRGAGKKR